MKITPELLRKKAEHNEGMLSNLEEIALHQLNIEKIENFDKFCRHIKILLLQNNQIEKIENLKKLKELEYLNLALNNISKIENLENCENLNKLDLTCNFIESENLLESLFNLKKCGKLREVYFTGNPCGNFKGFRLLVISIVTQLITLDGKEIKPSERIIGKQNYAQFLKDLKKHISEEAEIQRKKTPEELEKEYNKESRKKMYLEDLEKEKAEKTEKKVEKKKKRSSQFLKSGEMRQCNEGKYEFKLFEYKEGQFTTFHLKLPKYMDTSLIKTEIYPNFISVRIREKLTQVKLWEEVFVEPIKLQRSSNTGELFVKLKKCKENIILSRMKERENKKKFGGKKGNGVVEEESDSDDMPDLI